MDIKEVIAGPDQNVNDVERWFSVVAGAALAVYGLSRRSAGGIAVAGIGGALLLRGATGNCPAYRLLGISTHEETATPSADLTPAT